jgi:hypothetical protein
MVVATLRWLVIILGVSWLLLKLLRRPARHEDEDDGESHGPYRK